MAEHGRFDFLQQGFRSAVPEKYHDAARQLEAAVRPHTPRLILGSSSIRSRGGAIEPNRFCHYGYLAADPGVKIAVFNVEARRAVFELYCTKALGERVWKGAADTGTRTSLRPRFYIRSPDFVPPYGRGYLTLDQAIDRLGMALDDVEEKVRAGRLKVRWTGEAIMDCILQQYCGSGEWFRQASPDWLHEGRSKPLFDFFDIKGMCAVEVMGGQHFASVEYFGGDSSRASSNKRTVHKARACRQRGIPLLFVRWQTGTALEVRRRSLGALEDAGHLMNQAFTFSLANGCQWIDLDEFVSRRRFEGYSFLRSSDLPSAID